MNCDLLQKPLGINYRTRSQEKSCVGCASGARRQVMVDFDGLAIDLVTSVWSAHAHQQVVFGSDMAYNISLSFTAVLSSNQDIHERSSVSGIEFQEAPSRELAQPHLCIVPWTPRCQLVRPVPPHFFLCGFDGPLRTMVALGFLGLDARTARPAPRQELSNGRGEPQCRTLF